jgi:hypothetical protein
MGVRELMVKQAIVRVDHFAPKKPGPSPLINSQQGGINCSKAELDSGLRILRRPKS